MYLYNTPFDMFEDFERKELIKVTKKDCPGCNSDDCLIPTVIIPDKRKLDDFINYQITMSKSELEKISLRMIKECNQENIQRMYITAKFMKILDTRSLSELLVKLIKMKEKLQLDNIKNEGDNFSQCPIDNICLKDNLYRGDPFNN